MQARFKAYGCPSTIATADWLCEWLQGRRSEEVLALAAPVVAEALGLQPTRRYCAVLAEDVVRAVFGQSQVVGDKLNRSADKMSDEGEVTR